MTGSLQEYGRRSLCPGVLVHREKLLFAMHLTQKGYCFGVLLIHAITTITLPSAGWCEPAAHSSHPSFLHHDRKSVLTTKGLTHPSNREGRQRLQRDSRPGGEARNLPYFPNFQSRDGTQTKTSTGRPEQTLEPKMASSSTEKRFKNRNKPKLSEEGWLYPSINPPNVDCGKGNIKHIIHGKFYITGQLEANIPNVGYQSDSAVSGKMLEVFPEFLLLFFFLCFF